VPDGGPVRFGIVGSGWRSAFFLRVARELPDRFEVTGLLTRDPTRATYLLPGTPTRRTIEELLADAPAFVVVSVPWPQTPVMLRELAARHVAVLAETPPAPDIEGLLALRRLDRAGDRIQVAEQYQFQPLHAARLAIAASGRLGRVSQAQVSTAHGYHGIDLIRRFLGDADGAEGTVAVRARWFRSPVVVGPDRLGPPTSEQVKPSRQIIAELDYGDRLGVLDFADEQYFSWVRSHRVLVRGERGEIHDLTVRWLADYRTPLTVPLLRHDTGQYGNHEGYHHVGITAGGEWMYRNPYAPGRLSDDEIAVATTLTRMAEYVEGGPGFCSLRDGVHDHYLTRLTERAADTGETLRADGHLWD
jgi:predicted dehydrogenase